MVISLSTDRNDLLKGWIQQNRAKCQAKIVLSQDCLKYSRLLETKMLCKNNEHDMIICHASNSDSKDFTRISINDIKSR